ncbi:MAG: hypothetical protein ACM3P1_08460 [Candidatus Saccharibacteria bacterium]
MRTLTVYCLLLVLISLISGCKEDSPEVVKVIKKYIVAGDTIQNQSTLINDSIIPAWQQHFRLPVDLNQDTITDLTFQAMHDAIQGGTLNRYWSKLEIFKSMELLVDTSLFSNNGNGIKVITPKILNKNDTINSKGVWLTDATVDLSYYTPMMVLTDKGWEIKTSFFNGWNGLGRKYMGYRVLKDNDTIYGWLEIKIEHYNNVHLYQAAHR